MEDIAPPLQLALQLRMGLERGEPIRKLIKEYITNSTDELSNQVAQWIAMRDQGLSCSKIENLIKSPYRKALLYLIEKSLRGEGILTQLIQIEEEIKEACRDEIDKKIALMPIKALIPLLFLQFPALLILLFMPLLGQLTRSL